MERPPQGYNPEIDRQLQCPNPELEPIANPQRKDKGAPELGRHALRGARPNPIANHQRESQAAPELGRHALHGAGLEPIRAPAHNPQPQPKRELNR